MSTRATQKFDLKQIFKWIVSEGLIDASTAKETYAEASSYIANTANLHPLTALGLCKMRFAQPPHRILTLDWLSEWAAEKVNLPYYRIDPLKIDFSRVADVISATYAARFNILPVDLNHNELLIATAEPYQVDWVDEIARVTRMKVRLVFANPLDISQYISQFFAIAKSIRDASRSTGQDVSRRHNFEQLVELGKANKQVDANDQHIVSIVDWLWQYAFEQRASDIHLEPKRDLGIIRFRIDGVLHQVYQVPPVVMMAMVARIKLLGRMDVIEKRRPQDGRIKTVAAEEKEIELRLSTLPTAFGEKLVMRIFDPEVVVKTLPELGFPPLDAVRWDELTKRPYGIILVTGPTGSGKTTTLYTTLKTMATPEVNVSTVEDPIEMVEASFNQMQVNNGIDVSFADGVRALMRQDPDIIMIGEIRDRETAEMAVQAALTGHLVLSTLHTNDAPSAVMRLLELGVPFYLLESTLIGVLAQRLVRTLCTYCRAPGPEILDDNWQALTQGYAVPKPETFFQAVGCIECRQTGYRGRTGLYELLTVSRQFASLIRPHSNINDLRNQGLTDGMRLLRIAGAAKIASGETTLEEVIKVTSIGG